VIQPIDVTQLAGVIMGCAIPLIAVTGIMVRVALKPIVEALARARGGDLQRLEDRVALLERRLELASPRAALEVDQAELPAASLDPSVRLRG
jgi:hypothetical protein